MPNVAAVKKQVFLFQANGADETEDQTPKRQRFLVRLGIDYGVIMVKPDTPKGWGWNPAVLTLVLVIVGMMGGLVSAVAIGGYYVGQWDAERRFQNERINQIDSKAEDAKTKATYAARDVDNADGHTKPAANIAAKGIK